MVNRNEDLPMEHLRTNPSGNGRHRLLAIAGCVAFTCGTGTAADESTYWRLVDVPEPEGVAHEVGAVLPLGGGRIMTATRRGDVWIVENAYESAPTVAVLAGSPEDEATTDDPHRIRFTKYADGLQEPLGLAVHPDEDAPVPAPRRRRLAAARAGLGLDVWVKGMSICDIH